MRVRFWGTRGSCPTPGADTVRYGGNTTCLELRTASGALVILDAGTGIRELGRSLVAGANGEAIRGDIFFSHAHWDHIQGLPFFTPAFQSGNDFTLWGAPSLFGSLGVVLRQQMSPVVFPVAFDDLGARMEFRELQSNRHEGAGYSMRAIPVRHPGGALGFRFDAQDAPGQGLVFIPDNELDAAGADAPEASTRDELLAFVRGARVLVHDAMYTGTEYMHHRGWGHSSYRDAIEFALDAGVETLVLFHHDPERTDDAMDEQLALCRQMVEERKGVLDVQGAMEGVTLELD
ncbi:MAG: MBL fold metallo-hydrolase [Cytophagaceae bacterium]|nr:MBL fold metallo-hydrolase [Gemmatimonadaceae bacterium]